MRRIAIISKPQKPELATILPELIVWLKMHKYQPILDPISASYTEETESVPRHQMHERKPELVIVLGGDGTLLAAARAFARSQTPILSVNLGSLGFLAEVPLPHLYPTLEAWRENACTMDERAMIHAEVRRDGLVHREFEALNDVVITKGTIARMVNIVVRMADKPVAKFRADGVIVSSPIVSTLPPVPPLTYPDVQIAKPKPPTPVAKSTAPPPQKPQKKKRVARIRHHKAKTTTEVADATTQVSGNGDPAGESATASPEAAHSGEGQPGGPAAPATAPAPAVLGQLSADDAVSNPSESVKTEDLIVTTEARLKKISSKKQAQHKDTFAQVQSFLAQAKQALAMNDNVGAETLANKAKILLDELLGINVPMP